MARGTYSISPLLLVLSGLILGCSGIESSRSGNPGAPFKAIGPGIYELGLVKIDRRKRTVCFPAAMNLNSGVMEYFLVSSWGKVHESVLRTETEPYHIHAAMLLLGARGIGTNDQEILAALGPYVSHPSSAPLPGDKITVEVSWRANGTTNHRRAEELIWNSKTQSSPAKGCWVYNGSLLDDQSFLAQREGSIISLVTDPEALINNVSLGHDNDTIWTPNSTKLPPTSVPVDVTIKLIKARAQATL